MKRAVAALCACLTLPFLLVQPCTAARALPVNVAACISRLDSQSDIGYERIAARCPDLARQLESSEWAAWLPQGWKEPGNDLSLGGLRELVELGVREAATTAARSGPDIRTLPAILGRSAAADGGVWAQFEEWLRSILESTQHTDDHDWYARMVSNVGWSEAALELISYLALAGIVAVAALIGLGELRNAGVLARRGRATAPQLPLPPPAGGLQWSDIERAPWVDRPRLLLELLTTRLGERGELPPPAGLTVRELTAAARIAEPDRGHLTQLALAAERVRFSDQEIRRQDLEQSLVDGRQLLQRLGGSVRS